MNGSRYWYKKSRKYGATPEQAFKLLLKMICWSEWHPPYPVINNGRQTLGYKKIIKLWLPKNIELENKWKDYLEESRKYYI